MATRDSWKSHRYLAYDGTDILWPAEAAYDIDRTLSKEGHDVRLQAICEYDERGLGPDGSYVGEYVILYRVWVCWKHEDSP